MTESTRILILSPPLDLRGTTVRTRNLVRALAGRGYEFHVAAGPGPLAEAVRAEGAILHPFPSHRGLAAWLQLPDLMRLVRRIEPDILDLRHHSLLGLARPLLWGNALPIVVSVSTPPAPGPLRLPKDRTRAVIAVSDTLAEELVNAHQVPRALLSIARDATFAEDGPIPPPSGPAPVVGFMGRLEIDRGIELMPGVARRVLARVPNAVFMMVGEGADDLRIRRRILGDALAQGIHVVSPHSDYRQILKGFSLLLSPAIKEGLGILSLEAMAVGRPVVAAAVGGVYSHIKDGRTGLLARPGDEEDMAAKIIRLLEHPEEAAELGHNARELVREEFSLENFARELDLVYKRAAAFQPRGGRHAEG